MDKGPRLGGFDKDPNELINKAKNISAMREQTIPRKEITDTVEIEKKIEKAKKIFNRFLLSKAGAMTRIDREFLEINFDNMLLLLELSEVPKEIAMQKMDEIVLSFPGIAKTDTGYKSTDTELLLDIYKARRKQEVKNIFESNKNLTYTTQDIAKLVGIKMQHAYVILQDFIQNDVIEKVGQKPSSGNRSFYLYRYKKTKKT